MKNDYLIETISSSTIRTLSRVEHKAELKRWDDAFCMLSDSEKASIYYNQYKWHLFSYERVACLKENEAAEIYMQHKALEYYVVPQIDTWPHEVAYVTLELPDPFFSQEQGKDFYVYPTNMAWTMAFTHEHDYIGPFFAKHPNYEELNNENKQALNNA